MKRNLTLQQVLASLGKMVESGHAQNALPAIQKLNQQFPSEPNVLHLSALALDAVDSKREAKDFFEKSLKAKNDQPPVHNNFANFLKAQKQIDLARYHYKQAIHYNPKFTAAWRNLAILEFESNNLTLAYEHALKAASFTPNSPTSLTLLGNICRKNSQFQDALGFFQKTRAQDAKNLKATYGLAITYSDLEEPEKALALLEEVLSLAPEMSKALYAKALAELNLGYHKTAIETLEKLITTEPLHTEAHKTLNEAYWQLGNKGLFCESYRKLSQSQKDHREITIAHIESLIAAGLIKEAQSILESRPDIDTSFELLFLRGKIAEEEGELKLALKFYETVFSMQPDLSITKQYLITLVRNYEFEVADKLVKQALKQAPNDQLLWAIQGTCWKMKGNERYQWLTQNSSYIQEYVIPTPNGYSSLNEFLLELKANLLDMHKLKERPLFQSVRSGVQTPGRLLHKNHPVICSLKESLKEVISDYISNSPEDEKHPFLGRTSSNFKFSGSWSVMLKGGGHHVSHVHPQGWISSAFYVELPPPENEGAPTNPGDIFFGKSPYELGERDFVEKQISPSKGSLVLFPSYTWHGTIPLPEESTHLRVTTPFDVIPSN
ncbi:tetratricopeptide repeat protein [Microbulbifer sp. ZKSA002]|uniref:tetratricopeptide repeat protein n=1 Tax=Microbulbifer sp. ZKSA002 TaxID=3243388 RepID=UPI004038FF2D